MVGKISGQSHLALQLVRIATADGKTLDVHTTTQSMTGGTSYGKDAARIATGAAVGALIGGLTGGGRGAAIGAGAGAGGGTVWTLKTRGPRHPQRNPASVPTDHPGDVRHLVTRRLLKAGRRPHAVCPLSTLI